MKLFLCMSCLDIVSLRRTPRNCVCGMCGGVYTDDLNAEVWGPEKKYLVLGFSNQSLSLAIRRQLNFGDLSEKMGGIYGDAVKGRDFNAFIIPDSAPTVTRKSIIGSYTGDV